MSFLLLKSKSRSSRPLSTYRMNQSNSNNSNNSNNRNHTVATRNTSNSHSSRKYIETGGGQVQLQRPQKQQKRQINKNDQVKPNQQQQSTNDVVISMDEVMEDLRVLEQQQRDSQRLLASIKLTKQHKLEQRVSLESKLSSLKFSNGQARAQLLRARDVLSKSTRELGNAKLCSERSSDNLKRFDDKLKRTLGHVRGLHSKRRQVEQAIVKLRNEDTMITQLQRTIAEKLKTKETERDDAVHRQKLLGKTIQTSKIKTQELVEEIMKMRSELSELENDLTTAQQMEASAKFRSDSVKAEISSEQKRHVEAKHEHESCLQALKAKKIDLEMKVRDTEKVFSETKRQLNVAFNECIRFQKEDGLELSDSPETATFDMQRICVMIANEESDLRVAAEEVKAITKTINGLQQELSITVEKHSLVQVEKDRLDNCISNDHQREEQRKVEREKFMSEFRTEEEEVKKLSITAAQFAKEQEKYRDSATKYKQEQEKLLNEVQNSIEHVEVDIASVERELQTLKSKYENQKAMNKSLVDTAKKNVATSKDEFDEVQKEADGLLENEIAIENEIKDITEDCDNQLNSMEADRSNFLEDFPCLANLDFDYNEDRSDEEQIETALSDLRSACDGKIESARKENDRRLNEAKVKAAKEERHKQRKEAEARKRIEKGEEEEARVKAAKEERHRQRKEAEERKRIELEEAEEEARVKATKEERQRQRQKAVVERKLIEREEAEEEARVKAAKQQRIRQARDCQNVIDTSKSGIGGKDNRRQKSTYGKRSNDQMIRREDSKMKVGKNTSRVMQQRESDELTQIDQADTNMRRHKSSDGKRIRPTDMENEKSRNLRNVDERERNRALVKEKEKSILKKSNKDIATTTRTDSEERRKTGTKLRKHQEVKDKMKSNHQKHSESDARPIATKSSSLNIKHDTKKTSSGNKSSKRQGIDDKTKKAKIQKLDIFSSTDRAPSKLIKNYPSSRDVSKSKESTKLQESMKRKISSHSQNTATSKKSFSSTRRRKHVSGTNVQGTISKARSMDMDFSFM